MIWRQSAECHTVEHNGGTRPLWLMQTGNQAGMRPFATDGGLCRDGFGHVAVNAAGPAGSTPARDNQA